MRTIAVLMIGLSANGAGAAAPLAIDFATGKPADYFTEDTAGRVRVSPAEQDRTMVISDVTCRLRDVPVKPGRKYTLSLKAAFQGDVESFVDNPRFAIFTRLGPTSGPNRVVLAHFAGFAVPRPGGARSATRRMDYRSTYSSVLTPKFPVVGLNHQPSVPDSLFGSSAPVASRTTALSLNGFVGNFWRYGP